MSKTTLPKPITRSNELIGAVNKVIEYLREQESLKPNLYKFADIFEYHPKLDVLLPKFKLLVNGQIIEPNKPIRKGELNGGLDWSSRIGPDLAGFWDKKTETLKVVGLYP